jgi:hypothetical protein
VRWRRELVCVVEEIVHKQISQHVFVCCHPRLKTVFGSGSRQTIISPNSSE